MAFAHVQKGKGDGRMIGKIVMLLIGIFMGVSLMSILQVASDADDQMEEEARKNERDKE